MQQILNKIQKDKVKFIELQFTDLFGTLKSIEIPVECVKDAIAKGVWFDGSSINGFARLKESDMYLLPDLSTYAVFMGSEELKTARFFCDVYGPDGCFSGSPRGILKKVINEGLEMGYAFKVGPELEFYLFEKKDGKFTTPQFDTGSYFDSSAGDIGSDLRKEIMIAMKSFGISSERAHHEVGVGQHEIGFKYDDPLGTADRVVTLKKVIKSLAHKHGLIASFMPKPMHKKPGNGMHIHFSLFDLEQKPLFFDAEDQHKLSAIAKSFIAGIMYHAKEITALTNPTVSSYKRLVPGFEAPVYICWGGTNRSALIRIPRYTKGKESSARGELRSPDPSASPYLAFAAMLKAGLEGVKKKMKLAPELKDSAFEKSPQELVKMGIKTLPGTLEEAISIFKKSKIMNEMLGDELFQKYIEAKESEAEEFRTAVTEWEISRYLEKS